MSRLAAPRHRLAVAAFLSVGLCAVGSASAFAQQAPPGTDIFVAELREADGRLTIGAPRNVTARAGYDNQPAFTPDGARSSTPASARTPRRTSGASTSRAARPLV